MATYDLTVSTNIKFTTGDILNCPYSGTYKKISVKAGTYTLECWGASGGGSNPGLGGYVKMTVVLSKPYDLYLYAGGQGSVFSSTGTGSLNGGFNGGGKAYRASSSSSKKPCSGGGASDVRIGGSSFSYVALIAGGGGGTGYSSLNGGSGGGSSGEPGAPYSSRYKSGGAGTSSTGGTSYYGRSNANSTTYFTVSGQLNGASGKSGNYISGGGGGYYGGGAAGGAEYFSGAGGGSGYTKTSSSRYTVSGSTSNIGDPSSFKSPSGSTEYGHTGNGYVRITVVSGGSNNGLPLKVKVNGSFKDIDDGYVKVNGSWKTITDVKTKVNGTWKTG